MKKSAASREITSGSEGACDEKAWSKFGEVCEELVAWLQIQMSQMIVKDLANHIDLSRYMYP